MRQSVEAPLIGVLSGKGGVGKTNLVANLAVAAAGLGSKVLLVDGDLGLANVDVLLGLSPPRCVADVLAGACCFEDALLEGPRGVHVLAAASGRADLPGLRPQQLARLLVPLFQARARYDLVLLDAGAGLGPAVLGLAASCDRALLLTTPEPTALADGYATLKVLRNEVPALPVGVVVNGARDEIQARSTHAQLERLAKRFLASAPPFEGWLPRDRRLVHAVARQRAVVELFPLSASARHIAALAQRLIRDALDDRPEPVARGAQEG